MRKTTMLLIAVAILVAIPGLLSANPYSEPYKTFTESEPDSFYFDSLNVRFAGNWPFGNPYNVAYDSVRNLAFLGSGTGVYIIDISDPSNPVKISESIHSREFILWELFYDESTQQLYLGVARWFEIWDVSNPYAPVKLSHFFLSGPAYADGTICASGDYAYCADDALFAIVDVSIPTDPQIISELPIPARSIAIKDSFAYLLQSAPVGLHVIDISDPYNPAEVSFLGQSGGDIAIHGSRAYISSDLYGLKFRIVDISDPYNPYFCGYFDSPRDVYHAHVVDTIAYLATDVGLRAVNIADPMNAQEIAYADCRGRDIFVIDTVVFAADRDIGLRTFNNTNFPHLEEMGRFITPGRSFNSQVSGSFAYVANQKGLWIIDVSDPINSIEVGRCYTPCEIFDIRLSGSFAFATDRDSSLIVFDISNPSNPYMVTILNPPGDNYPFKTGLYISGQYAFVADGYDGLRVIDISNPSFPYEVGQCSIHSPNPTIDVEVSGHYAYVISGYYFLTVVDISNPSSPETTSNVFDPSEPADVCVSGGYAFVTDSFSLIGLYVIDISDPYNAFTVCRKRTGGLFGIDISGQYAYVSRYDATILVYDISQPWNPIFCGKHKFQFYKNEYWGLCALGTYAYVSSDCGLQIYQFFGAGVKEEQEKSIPHPSSLKLLQNPVSGNYIEMLLNSPAQSKAEITLYNQIGQRVKACQFNGLKAGENRLRLDAKGLPAGIYFLKLDGKPAAKVVKIK